MLKTDLPKVFDCLQYDFLLAKLNAYMAVYMNHPPVTT